MKGDRKKKYLKVRPFPGAPWCYVSFSEHALWDGIISEMDDGRVFEIRCIEMTEDEYKMLPEFWGW